MSTHQLPEHAALIKLIGQLEMARYRIRESSGPEERQAEIERTWKLVTEAAAAHQAGHKAKLSEAQRKQRLAALELANRIKRETGRLGGRPRKDRASPGPT
ncbi:MAG: hypothetical protein RL095_3806 [Verrucomicrobiota bacterium]|jgi:hypothetical protein